MPFLGTHIRLDVCSFDPNTLRDRQGSWLVVSCHHEQLDSHQLKGLYGLNRQGLRIIP